MVTHQVHFLTNVNKIILLNNGEIKLAGTYDDLINSGIDMNMIGLTEADESNQDNKSITGEEKPKRKLSSASKFSSKIGSQFEIDRLISSQTLDETNQEENDEKINTLPIDENVEKKTVGLLSWKMFFNYFRVGGGYLGAILIVLAFIVSQILIVSADYWVSNWASKEDIDMLQKLNFTHNSTSCHGSKCNYMELFIQNNLSIYEARSYNYKIYLILISAALVMNLIKCVLFFVLSVRSSKNLHKSMFKSVLCTAIRFFDVNPLGRVINRFSKDIGLLDEVIPLTVFDFAFVTMLVMGSLSVTMILNYWVILPTLPLVFVFLYVRKYFLASSVEIKRIEGINRSPIYVHVNNTILGITTIRTANKAEKLCEEFYVHTNYHTRAVMAFLNVNRWLAVRLDWIATSFTYLSIFSFILFKDYLGVNSGQVGLMLVYLCQLVGLFQWTIRQSCEVENLMTSVERILEYVDLPNENNRLNKDYKKKAIKPSEDWPQNGEIVFDNVSYSYSKEENLPNVLSNLSFKINKGEKIGIVGRTGAGKSSIIQTLFRMSEPDGSILIDNINIKELNLSDLRSRISIIPQEPTLFIGTIRTNLDPFNKYSDQLLWDALDKVQLKDMIKELKGGLEYQIEKAGSNLSVGQKQLICLARAIVKKTKVLVIDEATANVDFT